jgi:starch-binding outer membrane protein, SusD/RagB family
MKNSMKTLFAGLLLIASQHACKKGNFLDTQNSTDLTEASVFSDSARILSFLTGIYSSIGTSFNYNRWGGSASYMEATDEVDARYVGATNMAIRFANGTLSSSDAVLNQDFFNLTTCYQRIRQANLFLSKVDNSPLSAVLKTRTKAEARFLRAWYYAMLIKAYGGVQLVDNTIFGIDDDITTPRSAYADCVEYVVRECELAATDLPLFYTGLDYGRITRGACLALKCRVLLYAASPLFNGGSIATDDATKKLTSYPVADPQRWARAAQAAKDVIDLNQYQLEVDNATKPGLGFYKLFLKRVNTEYILAQMLGLNKTAEAKFYPPSRNGNDNCSPLQNVVDRFGMNDGMPYDPAISDNNPYVNRDPRFYYSFIYNGASTYSTTGNVQLPVYIYVGATPASDAIVLDNTQSNQNTKTGYYGRKMCDTSTAGNGGANTERCTPLIRYAEILLNYAEALNESGNTLLAIEQVKAIRLRAGIKPGINSDYGIPATPTQSELRALIQNERSVELAFEEHRFWDVRRWKIAPQTETAEMQGMQITKVGSSYTYKRFKLNRQHFWPANNNYYLMPYAQGELAKLPGILVQNPGW